MRAVDVVFGVWIAVASLIAMRCCRHKTSKLQFMCAFAVASIGSVGVVVLWREFRGLPG